MMNDWNSSCIFIKFFMKIYFDYFDVKYLQMINKYFYFVCQH